MRNQAPPKLHVAFIQDDNGDVVRGPAETYAAAIKRTQDVESDPRVIKTWTEEVK